LCVRVGSARRGPEGQGDRQGEQGPGTAGSRRGLPGGRRLF
jgi:hypothetical protein